MVSIVVSGRPGCGASSTARLLAHRLRVQHFSPGDYFKEFGMGSETERAISFWKTEKGSSKEFHKKLDYIVRKKIEQGNVVVDSKLGIKLHKGVYNLGVWLDVSDRERARRYAKRDGMTAGEAERLMREKESHERENFRKIYGFDYFSQKNIADVVIRGDRMNVEQIVDKIISTIKRVFIIHRWEGSSETDWYTNTKTDLEKQGYQVFVPEMPNPDTPIMREWVNHIAAMVGKPNENTFFIGHSAGAMAALRYIEQVPDGSVVGGCILVAGWVDDMGYKKLRNFFFIPVKWDRIRRHCRKFVAIQSDNDPFVKMYHAEEIKRKLRARLIVEHRKGHFTQEEGVRRLPSVIQSLKALRRK